MSCRLDGMVDSLSTFFTMAKVFGSGMQPLPVEITSWASIRVAKFREMVIKDAKSARCKSIDIMTLCCLGMCFGFMLFFNDVQLLCLDFHRYLRDGSCLIHVPSQPKNKANHCTGNCDTAVCQTNEVLVA